MKIKEILKFYNFCFNRHTNATMVLTILTGAIILAGLMTLMIYYPFAMLPLLFIAFVILLSSFIAHMHKIYKNEN